MKSLVNIIWYLVKLPFVIVFSAFKLVLFVVLVIAGIYEPIIWVGLLLLVISYGMAKTIQK
jgi:hypothetical protein